MGHDGAMATLRVLICRCGHAGFKYGNTYLITNCFQAVAVDSVLIENYFLHALQRIWPIFDL